MADPLLVLIMYFRSLLENTVLVQNLISFNGFQKVNDIRAPDAGMGDKIDEAIA